MKIVGAALIIALGIAAAGFLAGGRYEFLEDEGNVVVRLDRYTGHVEMCVLGAKQPSCGFILDEFK